MDKAKLALLDPQKLGDSPERVEKNVVAMFVALSGRQPTPEELADLRAEIKADFSKS